MKILRAVSRAYSFFLKIITALLAVVMFTLLCTTTWQVLSRYATDSPQTWPTDIATYGLVFLTFIGMGVLLRDDGHIRVDVLYMKLPKKAQYILDIVMDIVGIATLAAVTYFAVKLDIGYWEKDIFLIGSVFYTPKVYIFSFVPFGLGVTCIEHIRRLVLDIMRPFGEKKDDTGGESI